jgi:flagellar hook protein FlgE
MKASRSRIQRIVYPRHWAATAADRVSVSNWHAVAQQFTQGNISTTGNNLDVAINGSGFFQFTMPDGSAAYTRDGEFKLDKDGNIAPTPAPS